MATRRQGQVVKIYDLHTLGYDDIHKQLQNVSKDFEAIKKAKRDAEQALASATGTEEIKKYSEEVAKLKVKEQELRVQRQQMINEQKAAQIQRQAEINEQKQVASGNKVVAGSYREIQAQIKELGNAVRAVPKGSSVSFQGNTLQYDQAINKLKQLTAAEQEFRRQFQKDQTLVGEYTSGIIAAFRQVGLDDLIGGQVTKTKGRIDELNAGFDRLQKELQETKAAGASTSSIEKQMIENRNEVIKLDTEVARLRNDLRGAGDVGNQITTSIAAGFKNIKGQVAQFAIAFIGVQALLNKAQTGISDAKLISDQTTDLQIQLGDTAKAAENLNDKLLALNTRTAITGLQQIADTALKAGVAKENILGVTEAIDKAKVAFGKDFGSVEEGTETLAKLINIFFEDREITGDRILKISNSIRALANETVASVPFITDFSGRMAGLRQIANITLPDVIGLGAGFQEFKQSAETSSTALVKVIPKLAQDVEKFAGIAGVTNEEFKKLLTESPVEALLKVSEGLVAGKGDVEEFAKTLADAGLDAGRIITIIATLGGKADVFRDRIKRAGETIQETGAITDAFNKKNTNLAATIDKINKKFTDVAASKGFQFAISAISSVILLLIGNLPILLGFLSLLTISWAAQNVALIGLRAQVLLYNLGIGANLVLINVLRIANLAYIAVMFVLNGAYGIVTRAAALFNITLTKTPLGLILTAVTLLASAFKAFGGGVNNTVAALSKQNEQLRINRDVTREAIKASSDQRAEAALLVGVVKDLSISEGTRLATMKKLIEIDPIFQKALKDGKINYDELNKSLTAYNSNLLRSAELEAARARNQRETQKLTDLTVQKQDIEFAISTRNFDGLKEKLGEELNAFLQAQAQLAKGRFRLTPNTDDMITAGRKVIEILKKQQADQTKVVDAATQIFIDKQKQIDDAKPLISPPKIIDPATDKQVEVDIGKIKKRIDELNNLIEPSGEKEIAAAFKGSREELKKLVDERKKLQDDYDKLLGKDKDKKVSNRGSQLTGAQKDLFKDIEAERDKALADEEIKRQKNLVDEETYLTDILQINQDAINKKLALLKGSNAEERKQISQLHLEKLKNEQETNNRIFDIRKNALKQQLDQQIANIELDSSRRLVDQRLPATDRAQIKLDSDKQILALQEKFNADIDKLERQLAQQSLANTRESADAIRKTKEQILNDERELASGRLTDIHVAGENQISQLNIDYAKLRQAILNNDKLTAEQRARQLDRLAKLHNFTILSAELAQLTIEFKEIAKQYEKGLKTEQDYLDAKEKMEQKKAEQQEAKKDLAKANISLPSAQNTQDAVTQQLSKSFGLGEDSAEEQLLGNVIAQSFDLAKEAMSGYFEAERNAIQRSLDMTLQRIEVEKDQRIARAQSQAEIDSIEKEIAAKQRTAQRDAGEKLKKSRKSEAKIALASELANLAVAAASAGASTGPAAPIVIPILYAIMAGLALARYAINVGNINREQFAFGGKPGEVPVRGGKFGGRSHSKGGTPFSYKDRGYEAEVDELAVIRTKNAPKGKRYTVTGTQTQIASAINTVGGGQDFAPGAKIKEQKNVITNTVKKFFSFGGSLKEQKQISSSETTNKETTFSNDNKYYSLVIDRVMSENKNLVETRNTTAIMDQVLNRLSSTKSSISAETTSTLNKIVNEKVNREVAKVYSITGTTTKIYKGLDLQAKRQFAFGGVLSDVPIQGGAFKGRPHSRGGTDFEFKGKKYNAEAEELAIIATRHAPKDKKFTLTGTQMQLASAINRIGGGIDFKPGAKITKFASGGYLGDSLQAPIYVPSAITGGGNNDAILTELKRIAGKMDAQTQSHEKLADETSKRFDRLEVRQVTQSVTDAQKKQVKQSSVGTL